MHNHYGETLQDVEHEHLLQEVEDKDKDRHSPIITEVDQWKDDHIHNEDIHSPSDLSPQNLDLPITSPSRIEPSSTTTEPLLSTSLSSPHTSPISPSFSPTSPTPPQYLSPLRHLLLLHLSLLNILVSYSWLTYTPITLTASTFFHTTPRTIAWLSTSFLFAFVAASPFTLWALHRGGPRLSLLVASGLIVVGNWIRYVGTRSPTGGGIKDASGSGISSREEARQAADKGGNLGIVTFGQILVGLAQPFVLAAPTRFSEIWYSPQGRITATAIASLANPFGGALAQLVNPFVCTTPGEVPRLTLSIAVIATLVSIPSLWVPAKPPSSSSSSSSSFFPSPSRSPTPKTNKPPTTILPSLLLLLKPPFLLLSLPFTLYVSLFNTLSSLLPQLLAPFSFSEPQSGIAGGILILVGLLSAGVSSPVIDAHPRWKLPFIKFAVVILAGGYILLVFSPAATAGGAGDAGVGNNSNGEGGAEAGVWPTYLVMALLGAASFSLVPVVLEYMADVTVPAGAELSSTVAWTGGQLFGGVFILICGGLMGEGGSGGGGGRGGGGGGRGGGGTGKGGEGKEGSIRAMIFMAVIAVVGILPTMMLRKEKRKRDVIHGRGGRGR